MVFNWRNPRKIPQYFQAFLQVQWVFPLVFFLFVGFSLCSTAPPESDEGLLSRLQDDTLVLTRVGENVSISLLSLKNFSCREQVSIEESGKGLTGTISRNWVYHYQVALKKSKDPTLQHIFEEKRMPLESSSSEAAGTLLDFPALENPFTGYLSGLFSLENRLANDYRGSGEETLNGIKCIVLAFETTPEFATLKIPFINQKASLRQRGRIWVDSRSYRLIRISGMQQKLPKGWRSYQYVTDYSLVPEICRQVNLPARIEIKAEWSGRTYLVRQEYSEFKLLP